MKDMNKCVTIGSACVVFTMLLSSCGMRRLEKSPVFEIINARQQQHFPGVMGVPIVTTTDVIIKLKRDLDTREFYADSFWTSGYSDVVFFKKNELKKGDTLKLSMRYTITTLQDSYPIDDPPPATSPKVEPPVVHDGKLLFRYFAKNKQRYFSLKNIEVLEPVYAP